MNQRVYLESQVLATYIKTPSGNQTWQWKTHYEWRFLARNIIDFYGPFSCKPSLITRGYIIIFLRFSYGFLMFLNFLMVFPVVFRIPQEFWCICHVFLRHSFQGGLEPLEPHLNPGNHQACGARL